MKAHLKRIVIPHQTQEWYDFRLNGIGASECASILGLSEYKSQLEVYHEKIGMKPQWQEPNAPTFWGTLLEETVAEAWKYYDGMENDAYVQNHHNKQIIRQCKNVRGYIVNPKFPWLFASLDRVINKNQPTLIGTTLTEECPLEIKTANQAQLRKWESGLPIAYNAQAHQQMIVTETDYSEIAIFDNYRKFEVYPIPRNVTFANEILEKTEQFWNERVIPGKKFMTQLNKARAIGDQQLAEEIIPEIDRLEPGPENTDAYKDYMNKRFTVEAASILGGVKEYKKARQARVLGMMKKHIESLEQGFKNELRAYIRECEVLDLEDEGRVDWKEDKRGIRTLNIRLKDEPKMATILNELTKINYNL